MDPTAASSLVLDPAAQAAVDALRSAYTQGGWMAVAGLALMFGVRWLRMTEGGAAWWGSLTRWRKRAYAFGSGALGAAIVAISTGASLAAALPGALIAGAVATIMHHGSEKAAQLAKVRLTGNPRTDALLRLAFGHDLEAPETPAGKEPAP